MRPRRTIPALIALVLVGILVFTANAPARGGAGHNSPTKKLEDAFKVALYVRSVSTDGCYPPAPQLAKGIAERKKGLRVLVANGPGGVHRFDIVYVLRSGTACNHVKMALRASSGLYILNSAQGTIRVQGRGGPRIVPGKSGPPRGVSLISKTFKMSAPDQLTRFETFCPGRAATLTETPSAGWPVRLLVTFPRTRAVDVCAVIRSIPVRVVPALRSIATAASESVTPG